VTPPSRRCALRGDRSRDSGGGEAEGKKRAHQRTRRGACLGLGLERCERGDLGFESGELGFRVGELDEDVHPIDDEG
jgi:hypothetical protein